MKWLNNVPRWLLLGFVLPLLTLNGWIIVQLMDYFRQFVTIFIGANVLAFLLNYAVTGLQRWGLSRDRAILLVLLAAISLFFVLGVTLIPALIDQVNDLVTRLPSFLDSGNQQLLALQDWARIRRFPVNLVELATAVQANLAAQIQTLSGQIVGFGIGVAGSAVDFILTMVLTFYVLLHGDRLWNGLFLWLPAGLGRQIQQSLRQNFHNYFSGQAVLALLIGSSMILVFLILEMPFGLLFGLGVGVMTLVPFGAPLSICAISAIAAFYNIWLGMRVLAVGILVEQGIENLIAPRLLGRFTGLNPVWILVALLLGTRIAGLLGLVLAVPTAGFIKSTADMLRQDWNINHSGS